MRTRNDLDAVFRLLEEEVDEHLALVATPEPHSLSTALPLAAHRSRSWSPKRTAAAAVAAAAVVAGIAVGDAYTFGASDKEPAGFGADTNGLPAQSLIFAINASAGVQVVEVSAETVGLGVGAPSQEVDVFGGAGTYRIHIGGAGEQSFLTHADPDSVDVNGHRAHFGCVGDARAGNGFRGCRVGGLGWQYAPDASVIVFPEGTVATEAALLRIARALDFASSTPVRSPISLETAPKGMTLSDVDASYQAEDGDGLPSDKPIASHWTFQAGYGGQNSDDRLLVNVAPFPVQAYSKKGAEVTSVDGNRAYWRVDAHHHGGAPDRSLYIDEGNNLQMEIATGSNWTLPQVRAFAASLTVTAHPDDPTSWFDATEALP